MVRITLKKCWKAFSSNTRAITEARFAINPTSRLAFEDGSILTDRASLHITGPSISIVPREVRACSFVTTQLATLISTSSNFVQVLSRPVTVQRPVDSWRTWAALAATKIMHRPRIFDAIKFNPCKWRLQLEQKQKTVDRVSSKSNNREKLRDDPFNKIIFFFRAIE